MGRPENELPPEVYYGKTQASKYQCSTRIQTIQRVIAERAIQLLDLQKGGYVLDVGCGSGISGQILSENEYIWEGIDISRDMLQIAVSKENKSCCLWQVDIGQGWKVRPGVFDGVISVSTIQWLCVASRKMDNPFKRCCKFFQCLYDSLRIGGRAVLQFYPDGKNQMQIITTAAMKAGFSGGLVIDYPNSTKAKKYYLVIEAGAKRNLGIVEVKGRQNIQDEMQEQKGQEQEQKLQQLEVKLNKNNHHKYSKAKKHKIIRRKDYVISKKQRLRRKGKIIKPDTKYTGRKRKIKF